MTPEEIAKKIGVLLKEWPGKCHQIAALLLEHGLFEGELRYGHYHGTISPESIFGDRPFTHHGWIEQGVKIVDPTRWVFECVEPYIYVGFNNDEYDFGGNYVREQYMRPCPDYDPKQSPKQQIFDFSVLSEESQVIIRELTQRASILSLWQLAWIANAPLHFLQPQAKEIYQWIADLGLPGFIPFDNRKLILGKI